MIRNNKIILGMLAGSMAVNLCSASAAFATEKKTEAKYTIENGVLKRAENISGDVTLPDNITSIDKNAFTDSSFAGVTKLTIPGNVKTIGEAAFENVTESLEEVIIEEGVKEIGQDAFTVCSSLKTVTLPSSLTRIGHSAFATCESLTEITIPNKITKLEGYTFASCTKLSKINMSSKLVDFDDTDFIHTPWVKSQTDSNGLCICNNVLFSVSADINGSITIPSGVKKITANAFSGSKISSVVIPDSVTEMQRSIFFDCDKLKSVTLPKNIEKIDEQTFQNCKSLESITLPQKLKTIGKFAFNNCSKLTAVEIPASVTSIGESAFDDNVKLTGKGSNFEAVIKDMQAHKGDSDSVDVDRKPYGWVDLNGHRYYKSSTTGDVQRGWLDLDGRKYYFYNNGWMATGFVKLSDTAFYYCDPSTGELLTGWKYIDNKWYYFNPSASGDKEKGWMQTGWKYLSGSWYYFYSDGTMATGFINPTGDEYYFLDESSSSSIGIMKTGWQSLYGSWYYFNKSSDGTEGLMSKGWKKINGTWYYFYYGDGKMAADTWIDGYHVNSSGAWDR